MISQRKSSPRIDRQAPATEKEAAKPQSVARRKHPWLLALTATLVGGWIAFLAVMAWRG